VKTLAPSAPAMSQTRRPGLARGGALEGAADDDGQQGEGTGRQGRQGPGQHGPEQCGRHPWTVCALMAAPVRLPDHFLT
jgi:hypothetical protein